MLWGPARNPWDTGRTPGGSSGGSAAAVAAGIVPATIWFAAAAAQVAEARAATGAGLADFEADTLAVAELGRAAGVVAAFAALERRHACVASMVDFHSRYDYLLTPTLAEPPLRIGQLDSPTVIQQASRVVAAVRAGSLLARLPILDQMISQNLGWVPYTQLANLTGLPAMNVPLHRTAAGLPLGVQVVGRLGAEAAMLRLAAQLEAAQPWGNAYPAAPAAAAAVV